MLENSGSHVIVHDGAHGLVIYPCSLTVAKSLVQESLGNGAREVQALKEALANGKVVRQNSWLSRALHDVLSHAAEPRRLSKVIFGMAARGVVAGEAQIAPGWQAELLSLVFELGATVNKQSLTQTVDALSCDDLLACWKTLSFLAPARQRLGDDLLFVPDQVFEGYDLLRAIEQDRWKPEAKTHRVIERYHCAFLTQWGVGRWSVEPVQGDGQDA